MMVPKNEWVKCETHGTTNEHGRCDKCFDESSKPTEHDIATGDPQMRPDDITREEAAHASGEDCEVEECQECCGEVLPGRTDTERLNFMIEKSAKVIKWLHYQTNDPCYICEYGRNKTTDRATAPREAIDLAMNSEDLK